MKAWTKAHWKLILKVVVGTLVCLAVAYRMNQAWESLRLKGQLPKLDAGLLTLSGIVYMLGLSVFGLVFWLIMRRSACPIDLGPSLRAYLVGHLGKYIPGKALVVLMRVSMVAPYGATKASAAFATFYETFVMMAGGSLMAAVGFGLVPASRRDRWIASGLALAFLVVIQPKVFGPVSRLIALPFRTVDVQSLPRLNFRLLLSGLLCSFLGWILMGASQILIVRMFQSSQGGISVATWISVVSAVAYATVAGFVVPVSPGGLGVRELFLAEAIAPALGGSDRAIVSAVLLRLVWIVAEAISALLLVFYRPPLPKAVQT